MQHRLAIIGGGNMGSAIARGVLAARTLAPDELILIERDADRHAGLAALGCRVTADGGAAAGAEHWLLAVKPYDFDAVAGTLPAPTAETVVLSIMAGVASPVIRRRLGNGRIIRVMPNTPCQIGEGMTGIALGEGAEPGDDGLARDIFSAVGRVATVDESLMDAVTAVSGSGPAYVYALAEWMTEGARSLGLDDAAARLLVEQTIIGAGRMLRASDGDAAALRRVVTTPGGTTAAAFGVADAADVGATIGRALTAARDRGAELAAAAKRDAAD